MISHPLVGKILERLKRQKELTAGCGLAAFASSPSGLGLRLTPVQNLILELVGASREVPAVFRTAETETCELVSDLLGLRSGPQRLWLPPGSSVREQGSSLKVEFASPVTTLLLVGGRRSGKTTVASVLMSWLAMKVSRDRDFLRGAPVLPGTSLSLLNCACDAHQAKVLFRMLAAWLCRLGLVEPGDVTADFATVRGLFPVLVESLCSSSRSVRGRTAIGVCFDEFAHFQRTGGPLADRSMWLALAPSLATFGNRGLAVITTTPAGRSGVVWELFEERGSRQGMITFQLPTWVMNPCLSREALEGEFRRDEFLSRQEFGAEFLAPHGVFLSESDILSCVTACAGAPSAASRRHIHADLGLLHDSTAIVLGRLDVSEGEGECSRVVIEDVEVLEGSEDSPVSLARVENRILALVSSAGSLGESVRPGVTFDQHQSAFLVERLRARGIEAEVVPATQRTNQQSFSLLRELVVTRRIIFPDHPRLIHELKSLECTPTASGFRVEARRGEKDDCADAVAMCAWQLMNGARGRWQDLLSVVEP